MERHGNRGWTRIIVGSALSLAAFGIAGGVAGADTAGTTVNVSPSANLNATQNVSVSGTGFGINQPGTIRMTIQTGPDPQLNLQFSDFIGSFTTNSSGAFGPVTVTVTKTFTTIGGQQLTCSASQPCSVLASTDQTEQDAHQPITFADACAGLRASQASVNAQIIAAENALPANLPAAQRTTVLGQLEFIRAAANSQLAAALVAAGCPLR